MLNKFDSFEDAFRSFDLNGNGSLSRLEFDDGVRRIHYFTREDYDDPAKKKEIYAFCGRLFHFLEGQDESDGVIDMREFKRLVKFNQS